jgi:hypothetical protein
MEQKEVLLETVLQQKPCVITDIFQKEYLTFFSINGQKFVTYDNYIFHKNHVMYDHPVLYLRARYTHDPEKIVEEDYNHKKSDMEMKLWDRTKVEACKVLFAGAMHVLAQEGSEAFMKYIEDHVVIHPEDGIKPLLQQIDRTVK